MDQLGLGVEGNDEEEMPQSGAASPSPSEDIVVMLPALRWLDLAIPPSQASSSGTKDSSLEVVILSLPFSGRWVGAYLQEEQQEEKGEDSELVNTAAGWRYRWDVWVKETQRYVNAVGFSDKAAPQIRRQHLRFPVLPPNDAIPSTTTEGSSIGAPLEDDDDRESEKAKRSWRLFRGELLATAHSHRRTTEVGSGSPG